MDWVSLEGIQRVKVSYQVWKDCCRDLRDARKDPTTSKKTKKFLKEDLQNEFDELVDSILSLNLQEYNTMVQDIKSDLLRNIILTYYKN
jgi:hypothetical protein